MFSATKNIVRLSLFQPNCRICSALILTKEESVICSDCRRKIIIADLPRCPICGTFVGRLNRICGACRLKRPPFLKHRSFAPYQDTLKDLIRLYKYGQVKPLGRLLTAFYLELFCHQVSEKIDAIVPVPADRNRRREFQPVGEMAARLSRKLHLPLLTGALRKVRSTPLQAGLPYRLRLSNLNRAFKLVRPDQVRGRTLLLLDDVRTTGTTIRQCAAALRRGGATVIALTLAQTPRR